MKQLLLIGSLFCTIHIYSQDTIRRLQHSFQMEGQLVASTDGKGMFINAGGPALKFHFKKIAVSVNMMPSLRFQNEAHKPLVTPILGCGPQFYFLKQKRFILSFPCYYYTSSQVWTFTAGIGYLITTKK